MQNHCRAFVWPLCNVGSPVGGPTNQSARACTWWRPLSTQRKPGSWRGFAGAVLEGAGVFGFPPMVGSTRGRWRSAIPYEASLCTGLGGQSDLSPCSDGQVTIPKVVQMTVFQGRRPCLDRSSPSETGAARRQAGHFHDKAPFAWQARVFGCVTRLCDCFKQQSRTRYECVRSARLCLSCSRPSICGSTKAPSGIP